MNTLQKAQKDKPSYAVPKLKPRPTAASTARAARNATNRGQLPPHGQRVSPSRSGSSPKAKNVAPRQPRNDNKLDVKDNINNQIPDMNDSIENALALTEYSTDPHTTENNISATIVEETSNENLFYDNENKSDLKETDVGDNSSTFPEQILGINKRHADEVIGHEITHVSDISVAVESSRPLTPTTKSRPATPKSLKSSRPQTPQMAGRPSTPECPRPSTPKSRPNTPQLLGTNKHPRPLHQPSDPTPPLTKPDETPLNIANKENDIKAVFTSRQQQFQKLKKELDLKQQSVLEVFNSLRDLRERMCQEGLGGGEGLTQQELVVFNVADWASDELTQLCNNAVASAATVGAADVINTVAPHDDSALVDLVAKVASVPTRFADICLQAFTARQEVIDWVKELLEKHDDDADAIYKISRYNERGLELCEALREIKSSADSAVEAVTRVSKRTCLAHSALKSVGESLLREIAQLRRDLETKIITSNEVTQIKNDEDIVRTLEETRLELEEEKAARIATKEKLSTAECQLRQTRLRITKMDRQLKEAEISIANLTGTVKSSVDQSRQKEIQLETRARKLKECLKTGEVTSSQIAQQRDELQVEVAELKEHIRNMTTQHNSSINEMTNQLREANNALDEQKVAIQQELEQKMTLEATLEVNHITMQELKEKLTALENSKPNPELPTEREIDLWAELQATKETLRMTEEEITACKREKFRFLETMSKISEADNQVSMQQKFAAELLNKEEIVGKMQIQIRELTKILHLNEQKVIQYEQYIRDLQEHTRSMADCQESSNSNTYQDLQQEIMNVRIQLLETVHRNEKLTEMLVQKEQQLEQQDKTSRAQVREELINMLKNKETEQSRELTTLQQDLEYRMNIVCEVNKQISAKAEEIKELFATLENKQQQIHRLEKIVLALEEQQRRAQAQRTRHEEKIAALEHDLAAGGNKRERLI